MIFFDCLHLPDGPFVWVGVAFILFLSTPGHLSARMAGVCAASMALSRPVGAIVAFAVLATLALFRGNRAAITVSMLALILAVGGWKLRNHERVGTWALATNGGQNLYFGNHAEGATGWPSGPGDYRPAGTEAERDRAYSKAAINDAITRPERLPVLLWVKTLRFWFNLGGWGPGWEWSLGAVVQSGLRLALLFWLASRLRFWRDVPKDYAVAVAVAVAITYGLHVAAFAGPRFSMPLLPLMFAGAFPRNQA